jgi:hypothetical protein
MSATSFDRFAGSIEDMFDFAKPGRKTLILDPATGLPAARQK